MLYKFFSSESKIGLFLLALVYSIFYDYIYETFMCDVYSYMVGDYTPRGEIEFCIYLLVNSLVFLFYKGNRTVSSIFSLFAFLFIMIPMQESLYISRLDTSSYAFYVVLLACSQILFFSTDRISLFKDKFVIQRYNAIKNKDLYTSYYKLEIVSIVLYILLVIVLWDQIHFVNFVTDQEIMYNMRENSNISSITQYLLAWESYVFLPFCFAYQLINKNVIKSILFGSLFMSMYMMDYQKITMILPLVVLAVSFLIRKIELFSNYFHSILIVSLIVCSYIFSTLFGSPDSPLFTITATLIMRTTHVSTWLFNKYLDFFEFHPETYYTHINIINKIFGGYPYASSLGRLVTGGSFNANANFMITDGYAALKYIGIIIVSLLFIILKSAMNGLGEKYRYEYCILTLIPILTLMMNVSIFTGIITYGLAVYYIIMRKSDYPEFIRYE